MEMDKFTMQQILENLSEGFILAETIFNKEGQPSNYRILEYSLSDKQTRFEQEQVLDSKIRELLDSAICTEFEAFGDIIQSGKLAKCEKYYEDLGRWFEVQAHSLNKDNQFIAIFSDITERKETEETRVKAYLDLEKKIAERTSELQRKNSLLNAEIERVKQAKKLLQENDEKYRTIFNSMDEAFCIIEMVFDSEGKPIDWCYLETNPAHEMFTRMHNIIGKLISQLAPKTEPYWFETYGKVALTGEPVRIVEIALAGKRCYDLYAFKLGGQESRKVAIVAHDITERKKYEEQLKDQAKAIEELSTPVIQLWDDILALPLIGKIDSARGKQIMENLLNEIIKTKSSQVVIDITGVPIVDTAVASRLMRTAEAARLLGAECILSGISPIIAQTLVTVGVNLESIKTRGTLKNGLETALKNVNMQINNNSNSSIK